jgi:pectinesterase
MRRKLTILNRLPGLCALLLSWLHVPPAPAADITLDPTSGPSLQSTIDSLPADNPTWTRILLRPGTYTQQLSVTRPRVALIGLGSKPDDVILNYNLSAKSPKPDGTGEVGTSGSSSTFILAPDFLASNLTFANSTPDDVAQAVALRTQADRCIFVNCRFVGFQDTLYPTNGRCYFKNCYVTGDTDFIFGNATALFDRCTINSSDRQYITAANTSPETKHGFVFLRCTLTASPNVKPGTVYLGRPWQWDRNKSAAVTFLHTRMGPHIAAPGWHPWNVERNTDPAAHSRYQEFASTDLQGRPLDTSARVPWSRQLTPAESATYTLETILSGPDRWDPISIIGNLTDKGSSK